MLDCLCRPFAVLCCLLFFCGGGKAGELTLSDGEISIQVPVPAGFAPMDAAEDAFKQLEARLGAVGNELLTVFVRTPRTDTAEDLLRQYDVQLTRKVKGKDITRADFLRLRRETERGWEKEAARLKEETGIDAAMQPVHDHGDRYFSFVTRVPVGNGVEGCVITTVAMVRGRLWNFYVRNNGSSSIEAVIQAKEDARQWIQAIIAASPSDAVTLAREHRKGALSDFWKTVLIGGAVGGFIGLLLTAKRKKRTEPRT